MTKLYQKDPLFFALACICVYVCTFSASEGVSARLGAPYLFTVPAGVVLCLVLGGWIRRQGLTKFLGLCRFRGTAGQYLCFLPLMVPAGCNLWHGVQWNFPPLDTFIYILSMLLAGFLEEVLFRGLLFPQSAQCFECLFHGRRGHFPNYFRRSSHADGIALHPVAGQKSIKRAARGSSFFILLPPVPAQHPFYCPPDWPAGWRRTSAHSRPSPAEKASAPAAASRTAC